MYHFHLSRQHRARNFPSIDLNGNETFLFYLDPTAPLLIARWDYQQEVTGQPGDVTAVSISPRAHVCNRSRKAKFWIVWGWRCTINMNLPPLSLGL
ncbi:hypothetical protein XELAEV_18020224mg [Xenopus laevis]|uniref:Uncharacterized protein n=1 Tax=Xenopus laevis TaxID=8355 RepID=A0A974HQT6_XENLA|nr:hypothetical protein XELAEV_18020224mg [Xenopus laevis]